MPAFQYIAMKANGQRSTGTMEAESANDVAGKLKAEDLYPVEIRTIAKADTGFHPVKALVARMPVNNTDRIMLLRELAMMTRAGITLPNAVNRLGRAAEKNAIRDCMFGLQEAIQEGESLSEAMMKFPKVFPEDACHIIASAEQTGELASAFARIAHNISFWTSIKKKVIESVTYPVIILVVAIGVVGFMLVSFIPKLQRFLTGSGKKLPWFTEKVFGTADLIRGNFGLISLVALAIVVVLVLAWKRKKGRLAIEKTLLNVPIFGKIMTLMEMARFCGILGGMISSGATITNSLPILRQTMTFHTYKYWIDHLHESLLSGDSLTTGVQHPLIPVTAQSVIGSGEESGTLPIALSELEQFFSESLQRMLALIVSLVEPTLILVIGLFVGSIYLAMFLALLSINK